MGRRQVGIVVAGLAFERAPSVRLNGEDQRAEAQDAQSEAAADRRRIVLRRTPGGGDSAARLGRKRIEERAIVGEREEGRRRGFAEPLDQLRLARQGVAEIVALRLQERGDLARRGDGIETHRMGRLAGGAGIVRQDQRQPTPVSGRGGETSPACGPSSGERNAVAIGPMHHAGEFQPWQPRLCGLERDRSREEAAVELRQHHLHGEIGLRQPTRRCLPRLARRAGECQLQHRRIGGVERRSGVVEPGGEAGHVEHHRRSPSIESGAHERRGRRVLQAAHSESAGIESRLVERLGQGLDRLGVAGQKMRAIEDDCGERSSASRRPPQRMLAELRQGLGMDALVRSQSGEMSEQTQGKPVIVWAAVTEARVETRVECRGHGRHLD